MSPSITSPKCVVCGSTVGPTHSHWPEGPLCAKCTSQPPRPSPGASAEDVAREEAADIELIARKIVDWDRKPELHSSETPWIVMLRRLLGIVSARAARESERERVAETMAIALEAVDGSYVPRYEHPPIETVRAVNNGILVATQYRAQRPETETRT